MRGADCSDIVRDGWGDEGIGGGSESPYRCRCRRRDSEVAGGEIRFAAASGGGAFRRGGRSLLQLHPRAQ